MPNHIRQLQKIASFPARRKYDFRVAINVSGKNERSLNGITDDAEPLEQSRIFDTIQELTLVKNKCFVRISSFFYIFCITWSSVRG